MKAHFLLLSFCMPALLLGQGMNEPAIWSKVRYKHTSHQFAEPKSSKKFTEAYWDFKGGGENDGLWIVYCAKTGTPAFESLKDTTTAKQTLEIGEMLYVSKEKKEWLRVARDRNCKELVGWVHKRNLVLWSHPLVDYITNVEIKAFFINDYKRGKRMIDQNAEQYKAFDHPEEGIGELREKRFIYDVLFAYKYEKPANSAEGKYLVSSYYSLGSATDDPFIGWVSENRLRLWTTALCLEPNWDNEARNARDAAEVQANILIGNAAQENQFIEQCTGEFIFRTPERTDKGTDAEPRMRKDLMRYPIFGGDKIDDGRNCIFETGASGKVNFGNANLEEGMNESAYLKWRDILDEMERNSSPNIIFVLDAQDNMAWVRSEFPDWLNRINNDLRADDINADFGAVVYKNVSEAGNRADEDALQSLELTRNPNDLVDWIRKIPNGSVGDTERSIAYHALHKAAALLPKEQSSQNIIVHIGNSRDVTFDWFYNGTGQYTEEISATIEDMNREKFRFHYAHFTPFYGSSESDADRKEVSQRIQTEVLEEFNAYHSRLFTGVKWNEYGINKPSPTLLTRETEVGQVHEFAGAPVILRETRYSYFHGNQVRDDITQYIKDAISTSNELKTTLNSLLSDQSELSDKAGDLSPAAVAQLAELGLTENADFEDLVSEKAHLFFDGIAPQHVRCTDYPLFKLVLFIPSGRLYQQAQSLRTLLEKLRSGSTDEAAQAMAEQFNQLTQDMLGGPAGTYKKMSLEELNLTLNGLDGLDILLPESLTSDEVSFFKDISLKDLKKGEIKERDIDSYKERVTENLDEIQALLENEFYYSIEGTGERYYWVPLELYFN